MATILAAERSNPIDVTGTRTKRQQSPLPQIGLKPRGGAGMVIDPSQPINVQLATYYNDIRPSGGPDWRIRDQPQLWFPR